MPRKGENIYKRKDGRWEGRYIRSYDSEHKAKYAYVYGKTYSEVKRKLTEQRGNVQKVQPTKNKSSTYGELLDCWLHSMQLNTKESTQARYTHLIKTHIKPHLGAVQLSQLTTDVIEIFIEQQLTDGRLDNSGGLSPKTVTDILTIIKSTIEYARYKELPVICNLSKLSIKKKEKEMRVFTPSEQESLIGTLTNDMDHSKFGVLLSLYTGIRVGELCALQWEDFDLAHSKLKIRKTMQRIQDLGNGSVSKTKIVITEPKSQCSMDKAVELLHQAKQKYSEKALEEAERLVKEAKAYWPNHADVLSLEKTIQDERKQAADTIAAIMKDIQDKKMYAAQTKIDQAKANGFSIDPSVASKVTAVLKEVESQLDIMRNASGDEAFTIAMKLTELIADSDELNQSLKKFPPDEVPAVSSKRVGDEITLTWKPSPSIGEITYVVVRKENTYPNGPTDGSTVYNGKELAYTDSNAPKNTVLYYSVFAVRIGVHSKATRLDEAVAIVGKVTNLKAIGGDEMVTLSWTKAPTVTEIRLYKYCGYERPQDDSQYETIPCTRLDGLLVSGLTNGTNYWFAISAGHTLNGKTYFSEKAYLSAVPQKPAKPLQDFSVQLIDEVFQAKWTQSEWDVILFYAKQKPEYAVGTIYDLNELLSKYEKIDINLKSLTEAEFRLNFVGECYIVPGVINASNVILNVASYISSVPGAKDVSFDINSAATEMYVNFTWPKKIDRSLLVYRMDSYPTGIDDPLAHKIECSKRQYEANEGILISNPAKGTFYAEVYTYFESDRHRVYSDACRALLSNEPQKDVFYTLKYKKSGLFSKKCTLTVEIETEGACVFPAFAIVSKFKSTPLKRGDGDIVCTVNENTEIKGSHTFEFDVSPMKADTRLKMFFLNDKNYKSFKIACKAGNNI